MWLTLCLACDQASGVAAGREEGWKPDRFHLSLLHSRNPLKFPTSAETNAGMRFLGQPQPSNALTFFHFLTPAMLSKYQALAKTFARRPFAVRPQRRFISRNRKMTQGQLSHMGSIYKTARFICIALSTLLKQLHKNLHRCRSKPKVIVAKGKKKNPRRGTRFVFTAMGFSIVTIYCM